MLRRKKVELMVYFFLIIRNISKFNLLDIFAYKSQNIILEEILPWFEICV